MISIENTKRIQISREPKRWKYVIVSGEVKEDHYYDENVRILLTVSQTM